MPAEPFIGQIMMFGGTFAPVGWASCNGQIMSIAQNEALYNLLGTTYGGDGQNTFGLPDLRGRVPIHIGTGHPLGEASGSESVTLISTQLPAHSHPASTTSSASSQPATETDPAGRVFAVPTDGSKVFSAAAAGSMTGGANTITEGGNQPHSNMQPYLCINFCIALEGIYPSSN